ncbi:Voltage-gated Ion Channel (VIC) Superfamily [Thraustotheca clavata]|uniref:Voltage-gated Ion Channel (VIC) Superfamily n=1 Tax=Thraustotheca clavata TaxID=74557 RepID=A0A1W0A428_9STRA|nr:Voltage-gated Ion Channel (VIC) Superfamily [Thraustotheca clavata]
MSVAPTSTRFGYVLAAGVAAKYHAHQGEPVRGILLLRDGSLIWTTRELLPYFQPTRAAVAIAAVQSVRPGRQTTNFLRTSKYIKPRELPASDARSLSLLYLNDDGVLATFDVELKGEDICEEMLSYLATEWKLPIANVDATTVEIPTGRAVFCQRLYTHPTFGHMILACIVINIGTMALESPVETDTTLLTCLAVLDFFMATIFTVEQVIKIIALEGIRPIFHDNWNIADLAIIATSWLGCIASYSALNMSSFRSFRALRSLRFFKGLSEFFDTFLKTLPMVGSALVCFGYFLFLFAVLGMYLFHEALSHRCAVQQGPTFIEVIPTTFCRPEDTTIKFCQEGQVCYPMQSPNSGYTGFHSFEAAFLTVFMISSRAGFGLSFEGTIQTKYYFSVIYFLILIIFVSYMIPALFIAIVRNSFSSVSVKKPRVPEVEQLLAVYKAKCRPQMPPVTNVVPNIAEWCRRRVVQFVKTFLDARSYQSRSLAEQSDREDNSNSTSQVDEENPEITTRTNSANNLPIRRVRHTRRPLRVFFFFSTEGRIIRCCRAIGLSDWFEHVINVVIVLNAVLLAMEKTPEQPEWYEGRRVLIDHTFTLVFAIEILFRIMSVHGLWPYLQDNWNRLDFAIVCGVFLNFMSKSDSIYAPSQERVAFLFRMFRLLRPLSILRKKNRLLQIVEAIISSLPSLFDLVLFMVLGNVVFAILGMNLYGGKFPKASRSKFDTFSESMLTLFKISSGHGTWSIFYSALHTTSNVVATTYFLSYTVFSVYITLNFMIVILLRKFALTEDEKRTRLCEKFRENLERTLAFYPKIDEAQFIDQFAKEFPSEVMYLAAQSISRSPPKPSTAKAIKQCKVMPCGIDLLQKAKSAILRPGKLYNHVPTSESGVITPPSPPKPFTMTFHAFYFLPKAKSVGNAMSLNQRQKHSFLSALLFEFTNLVEWVFMFVLLFEFVIKIIGHGFIYTPKAYLNDKWNQLNIVVLLACVMLLIIPHSDLSDYFHLGRAFGPVRVIRGVEPFRVITNALMSSLIQVCWCILLTFFLFFVFACIGQQFFAGKFKSCNDISPHIITRTDCTGFFIDPVTNLLLPRVWSNVKGMQFDDISGSLSTLFSVVSKKAWIAVMYRAMDIVGEGYQPRENASRYFAFFFVAFVFISRFYMLRVFAGIIVNNFRCHNGTIFLTNMQLVWVRNKKRIMALQPRFPEPSTTTMQVIHTFVKHRLFRAVSSIAVLTHVIVLAASSPTSPSIWFAHYFFTCIYGTEAALTILSTGIKEFLTRGVSSEALNAFLVICMLMGPLSSTSSAVLVIGVTRAFDFNHLTLVLDTVPYFRGLSSLFQTLLESTRAMLKLTLLLGYVMFIYSNLGMQLFSLTKWSEGLDANLNFSTFPRALTAFIKFAAGEDWSAAFRACSVGIPQCVYRNSKAQSDCGSKWLSTIFYYSFFILVFLILQNFFVAVVLDTYVSTSALVSESESLTKIGFNMEHLQAFRLTWSLYDHQALGYMPKRKLLLFLKQLKQPLGLKSDKPESDCSQHRLVDREGLDTYLEIVARLEELTYRRQLVRGPRYQDNMIRFRDLLLILTQRNVPCESLTIGEKVIELATRNYIVQHRAAVLIQKCFRRSLVAARKKRSRSHFQHNRRSHFYYKQAAQLL